MKYKWKPTDEDWAKWEEARRGGRQRDFGAERERNEDWLYQRVRWLLDNLDSIEAAAGRVRPGGLDDHRQDFVRRYRDEPVPVWARLIGSKSILPSRLFVLQLALGGRELKTAEYRDLLPVLPASKPRVGAAPQEAGPTVRGINRAQAYIARTVEQWGAEYEQFEASHPDRTLAWVRPKPRTELSFPEEIWTNGWHLALDKDELAWFMAGFIFTSADALQNRQRTRLFGFGYHVNGIDVARHARAHLEHPAPRALARHFIDTISWLPKVDWRDDAAGPELPIFAFQGRGPTADEHPAEVFVVVTDHRVLIHRIIRACYRCDDDFDWGQELYARFGFLECSCGWKLAPVRWESHPDARHGYPTSTVHKVEVQDERVVISMVEKQGRLEFLDTDTRTPTTQHERSGIPFDPPAVRGT